MSSQHGDEPLPGHKRLRDFSRNVVACQRCRSKKVKCDHQFPACGRCVKAGAECVGMDPATGREVPRLYVVHLEAKIAALEQALQNQTGVSSPASELLAVLATSGKGLDANGHLPDPLPGRKNSNILFDRLMTTAVGLLTQTPGQLLGNTPHPPHVPHAAGAADATSTTKKFPEAALLPPKTIAQEYLKVYFAQLNLQLPILHREQFLRRYWEPIYGPLDPGVELANTHALLPPSSEERSPGIGKSPRDGPRPAALSGLPPLPSHGPTWDRQLRAQLARFQQLLGDHPPDYEQLVRYANTLPVPLRYRIPLYFVNTVFAIALLVHQLRYPAEISGGFRSAAQRFTEHVWLLADKLETLQGMLLLTAYLLMRPAVPGVWYVLGLALRLCVGLELHLELGGFRRLPPFVQDMRRRLFWCTYLLDRQVCVYLGRPFGIPEECIRTQFPLLLDDEQITEDATEPFGQASINTSTYKLVLLAMFKIRQIQGQIQRVLYTQAELPRQFLTLSEWRAHVLQQLHQWRLELPKTQRRMNCDFTLEFFSLNYYHALTLLHGLGPNTPELTAHDFGVVADALCNIAALYAQLARSQRINYLWAAVHNVFMASTLFLFCVYNCLEVLRVTTAIQFKDTVADALNVFSSLTDRCEASITCHDTLRLLLLVVLKIKYHETNVHPQPLGAWARRPLSVSHGVGPGSTHLQKLIQLLPKESGLHPQQLSMLTPGVPPLGDQGMDLSEDLESADAYLNKFFDELDALLPQLTQLFLPVVHPAGHMEPDRPFASNNPVMQRLQLQQPATREARRVYEMINQVPTESIWDQFFTLNLQPITQQDEGFALDGSIWGSEAMVFKSEFEY